MIRIGAVVALVCVAATAGAQPQTPRTVRAVRTTEPVIIDGLLAEDAWSRAEAADQFTQRDPDEGKPATERTEIRVLYDGEALYVGARMYDSEPSKIARRLSGRDESDIDADRIMVFLDPRHDLRTGVSFWVSAAGVQRDSVISNDTFQDNAWNAVWTSAVAIDDHGWSAELRIPYSQLRFNAADIQIWGMNVARFIHRKNETAWLELVKKNENGLASRMIPLVGLDGIRSPRQLELAPYAAVRQEFVEPENQADPFNDGARLFGSVGLDLKTRVPGGLTLDATINPDFGQAEVDPAVVNLSAFETFYPERRRFFIEGADIFDNFGIGGTNNLSGFNTSDPSLFYSRRIGRAPQGSADGEFVDAPRETTILGAAKLSGKTARGWSVGVVEALTGREQAHVVDGASQGKVEVEPLTNYFVARLQRDFSRGGAGFLTTSVLRNLRTPQLQDQLTSHAMAFGGDAYYFFDKKKDWVVTGKMSGTYVGGSQAAIADLQQAPQRYYQRPDAPQVSFDPTRRSLSGYAGRVNLNRNEGVWRVNASLWTVSPGFESNDLGFHTLGDRAGGHVMLLWRNSTPDRWTRSRNAWIARAVVSNFNNDLQSSMWFSCGDATFLNYWEVDGCAASFRRVTDDRLTRGGPIAANPSGSSFNFGFNTDSRKTVWFRLYGGRDSDEAGGWTTNDGVTINLKVMPTLTLSAGPQFTTGLTVAQYVGTDTEAVFAPVDRTEVTLTTRVNYILSPNASLQVYMQPLLSAGDYGDLKVLAAPGTFDFKPYVPAGGSSPFDDPDFNFKSLRLNAVFRWEFRPGSTIYCVWTQVREDQKYPGDFSFGRDLEALFTAPADDIFLVKLTYWIGR